MQLSRFPQKVRVSCGKLNRYRTPAWCRFPRQPAIRCPEPGSQEVFIRNIPAINSHAYSPKHDQCMGISNSEVSTERQPFRKKEITPHSSPPVVPFCKPDLVPRSCHQLSAVKMGRDRLPYALNRTDALCYKLLNQGISDNRFTDTAQQNND